MARRYGVRGVLNKKGVWMGVLHTEAPEPDDNSAKPAAETIPTRNMHTLIQGVVQENGALLTLVQQVRVLAEAPILMGNLPPGVAVSFLL